MTIEKLKAIAAKRHDDDFTSDKHRIAFEDMADKCFDEMLAVVEQAEELNNHLKICYGDTEVKKLSSAGFLSDRLTNVVQALHTKIEQEW